MKSGIYLITNTVSGKIYVGSSKKTWDRWRNHRSDLRRGKHTNCHLMAAWVRYGEDAFSFAVLEYCEPEDLMDREEWWINLLGTRDGDKGYNITEARPGGGMRGRKHTPETRAKMSTSAMGVKPTPEAVAKMRAALTGRTLSPEHRESMKGRKPWNKGKAEVYTDETKAKMSAAKAGKPLTPEHREKVIATLRPCGFQGHTHSAESKSKIAAGVKKELST
jgi:group I intron endonuclease